MKKLEELRSIRDVKNSELFQKYFVSPIYKELDLLKDAYSCDTLKELHFIKGKKQGLTKLIKILKTIDEDLKIEESLKSDEE